jgi:hypothetical protein
LVYIVSKSITFIFISVCLWPVCSKKRRREAEPEEEAERRQAQQEAREAAEREDMQRISALIAQATHKRVRGLDALDIVRRPYHPLRT